MYLRLSLRTSCFHKTCRKFVKETNLAKIMLSTTETEKTTNNKQLQFVSHTCSFKYTSSTLRSTYNTLPVSSVSNCFIKCQIFIMKKHVANVREETGGFDMCRLLLPYWSKVESVNGQMFHNYNFRLSLDLNGYLFGFRPCFQSYLQNSTNKWKA